MTDGLLDTNFVVRYLTDDPPELAEVATRVIEGTSTVVISPVVIVETAHVLLKVYGVPREQVVDVLVKLLQRGNVRTLGPDNEMMIEGLLLCRPSHRISFADALIWAEARSSGILRIYTFDKRFPSEGVELDRGN